MPNPYTGNRGQAVNYIPELVNEGLSNSQIVDFLKINDLGYRNQYMFQDINRIRLENFGEESIKGMSAYDPVPEKFMRTWTGQTEYNYRVVVKYEYFDTTSLEIKEKATTLYYDEPPSQSMVMDDWNVRRQTIENTYGNVQEVMRETQIHYYRNAR